MSKPKFQFTAAVVTLMSAITDDKGQPLTAVTVQPITRERHNEVVKSLGDNATEHKTATFLVKEMCGLSDKELRQLSAPDFNSLTSQIAEYISNDAAYFFKKGNVDIDQDKPLLLIPIKGDDGGVITQISLKVPTVITIDVLEEMEAKNISHEERNAWLTENCTGLSKAEQGRLCVQDWTQTQNRLSDFLTQTAEYFQEEMSS